MIKLRLSYTLLKVWKEGKKDEAIQTYLRMDSYSSPAMQRGSDFDAYAKSYIKKNKKLPPELGGQKLKAPQPGMKMVVEYNDQFTLSCEFDNYDEPEIHEFKNSTASDSAEWSNTGQPSMYFLIAEVAKLSVQRLVVFAFNPQTKIYDRTVLHKSKRRINEARADIEKYGPEIYEYFKKEGII